MEHARDGSLPALSQLKWHKSSFSNPNGNCVEASVLPEGSIVIRDSKHPRGPVLVVSPARWRELLDRIRAGEFP